MIWFPLVDGSMEDMPNKKKEGVNSVWLIRFWCLPVPLIFSEIVIDARNQMA